MKIAGFQKFTLIDFPGMISAIIFTQGCNFRCPWCHNPELVLPELYQRTIDSREIVDFLKTRVGKLDAVTITGGEPTLHRDLPDLIRTIRALGFKIKLDSNGTNPEMLSELFSEGLIDYVAMDIKTSLENYSSLVGVGIDTDLVLRSINLIKNSGVQYEFRTTMIPSLMDQEDILNIMNLIGDTSNYYIQHLECKETLDLNFTDNKTVSDRLWSFINDFADKNEHCYVR